MESREYDVIVYGASGYTGQFVAVEILQSCMEGKKIKWAVGGRSREKLEALLSTLKDETGSENVIDVGVLVADIKDQDALTALCAKGRLVISCVGPYRLYGEPVVKACVEAGTHYIDVSGEPEFLEKMQIAYHEAAKAKKVQVIGSCGFDSLIMDVGMEHLRNNFPGELTSVESFLNYHGRPKGNYGTYESLVRSVAGRDNLQAVRKEIFKEKIQYLGQPLKLRSGPFFSEKEHKYAFLFRGADASVVRRSQYHMSNKNGKTPLRFAAYLCAQNTLQMICVLLFAVILFALGRFKAGREFLLKHPKLCSFGTFAKGGLTRKELDERSLSCTLYGMGYDSKEEAERKGKANPDRSRILKIHLPEPGYVTASICSVQSAFTVLEDKLPNSGGVFTPAVAFDRTGIVSRLEKRGIRFKFES